MRHSINLSSAKHVIRFIFEPSLKGIRWSNNRNRRHSEVGHGLDVTKEAVVPLNSVGGSITSDNLNFKCFASLQLRFEEQVNQMHIVWAEGAAYDSQRIALCQYVQCPIPDKAVWRVEVSFAGAQRYNLDVSSFAKNLLVGPVERAVQLQ